MINRRDRILANLLLVGLSGIILLPLFFLGNTALKSKREFARAPFTPASSLTWQNFSDVWTLGTMDVFFKNSLIYAVGSVALTTVVALLAAYPLSRLHYRGANGVYLLFLSALFLPGGLIPTIFLMKWLGFSNSYHGFIILQTAAQLPFAVFVLAGFIRSVPRELDEAAWIDGCGYLTYIFRILLPLLQPAIATIAVFGAIASWNDFVNPYLYLTDQDMRPLTAGIYLFVGQYTSNWTLICAGVIVVAIPLLLAYIFAQRFIVAGLTGGALKG